MTSQPQNTPLSPTGADPCRSPEENAIVRIMHRLWRVDSAARAFPYDIADEQTVMKARWSVGLVQEVVRLGFLSNLA